MKNKFVRLALVTLLVMSTAFMVTACKTEKQSMGKGKDYKLSIGDDEAEEVVLSFDSNGGSEIFDIVVTEGDAIVLPSCTRTGYKFLYWKTATGTQYNAGDSVVLESDMTLTAEWEQDATAVLYGDVNADGSVNKLDRAFLVRYLAKWPEYPEDVIDMVAADVNCDGSVNKLDRAILIRHLAKWPEYKVLPYEN